MPTVETGLPLHCPLWKKVQFAYLSKTGRQPDADCGSMIYLRSARTAIDQYSGRGMLGIDPFRRQYQWKAAYYASILAGAFGDAGFDAILSPPSRNPFSLTFKSAFLRTGRTNADLSAWFRREKEVYAGSGPQFSNYFGALTCKGGEELTGCGSLIIADDILWRGITAAALLEHLRLHGLRHQARIHLACPLWLNTSA